MWSSSYRSRSSCSAPAWMAAVSSLRKLSTVNVHDPETGMYPGGIVRYTIEDVRLPQTR